jgi:glycosyltransferase involved in cell wall biosynthesis
VEDPGPEIPPTTAIVANFKEPFMQVENSVLVGGKRMRGVTAEGSRDRPLVTVVTAVYNGQPYVTACLESVLSQDYPNIEHIVLDAGSTDGTLNVLRQYDDRIALWKSEPDRGIYDAWNKGLLEAHGEWICFLGADDEFLPGAISAYMVLAIANPEAEYLSSKTTVVHATGYTRTLGLAWKWRTFSRTMCTAHVGSMHRRSLFDRLGSYNTSYRIVADYELLLRARSELNAAYMPVLTVNMRYGGVSSTHKMFQEQARAKVATGGRFRLLATAELCFEYAKFWVRAPLRHALGKLLVHKSHPEIIKQARVS